MSKTMKNVMHTIEKGTEHFTKRVGDETAHFAKHVGSETASFAKHVGSESAYLAEHVGSKTASLAKRVKHGTAKVARRVGAKRALYGAAAIGLAIGSFYLVRYIRERRAVARGECISRHEARRIRREAKHARRVEREMRLDP
ncbi:MAG TPA: hypothetical protein VN253_18210 [Kofleriaceae bacterium]|nr:hypothetical protein [Kofleriaceae bacterium]